MFPQLQHNAFEIVPPQLWSSHFPTIPFGKRERNSQLRRNDHDILAQPIVGLLIIIIKAIRTVCKGANNMELW